MDSTTHQDVYKTLRARVDGWLAQRGPAFRHAQLLLIAPDLFHLMLKLTLDPRVPAAEKAKLAGAIAYFASPIDALPEMLLGPVGLLDDIAVAAYALHALINAGHGAIAREHWAGEGELLEVVQQALGSADQAIGSGLWKKLRSMLDGR